jgi:general L-amino acid transport system permease protein
VGAVLWRRRARSVQQSTGRQLPVGWPTAALLIGVPLLAWAVLGAPTTIEKPELGGFDFQGGKVLSPEFTALLLGLSTYTAAFIAEVVRAGILAVDRGQGEAAMALGLSPAQRLRLVTLPQALRVIIPPMTSQYLNLAKNSSLAVAIGYPDLVAVTNTTMNQTGQAIEAIAILMAVYLTISLAISLFMNWYNDRMRLVER